MKGNTITQFMDDLYAMGGPEKEFTFKGKTYFLETYLTEDKTNLELVVFECNDENNNYLFKCKHKTIKECVEAFEKAKIFDGQTIYEAEKDIEVLFG